MIAAVASRVTCCGGVVRHRLMIWGLTAEFLVHFVLPVPAFPLSFGR